MFCSSSVPFNNNILSFFVVLLADGVLKFCCKNNFKSLDMINTIFHVFADFNKLKGASFKSKILRTDIFLRCPSTKIQVWERRIKMCLSACVQSFDPCWKVFFRHIHFWKVTVSQFSHYFNFGTWALNEFIDLVFSLTDSRHISKEDILKVCYPIKRDLRVKWSESEAVLV